MRKYKLLAVLLVCAVALVAAKPSGLTHFTSLWIGDKTDTADTTPGNNDLFVSGTAEFDGAVRLDGGFSAASVTRTIYFDIGAAAVDGANDVDDASAPNLTTVDGVPAILWDTTAEVAAVQWSFPVPADYSTGMTFYALISSDGTGSGTAVDWALTKNAHGVAFGSQIAQTAVAASPGTTLSTKPFLLTFTPDTTGAALFVDGAVITLELFNSSTSDNDVELRAVWAEYTATH